MENDTKEEIRKKMFETRLKSNLYIAEHKEESKELLNELKELRNQHVNQLMVELINKEKGEDSNVEHKRK